MAGIDTEAEDRLYNNLLSSQLYVLVSSENYGMTEIWHKHGKEDGPTIG